MSNRNTSYAVSEIVPTRPGAGEFTVGGVADEQRLCVAVPRSVDGAARILIFIPQLR